MLSTKTKKPEPVLKVSLALSDCLLTKLPPSSETRQEDHFPRMLEFSSFDEKIAVGRSSSGKSTTPSLMNALFLSRSVSRQHAELSVDPRTNRLMVEDLRSMHGTYLNGTKLATGITHYVHSGDVLQFGSDIHYEDRGHFAARSFKVSYGSAPPATKHTVPIQARRPGTFQVPEPTTDSEEEDDEVEILSSTDSSFPTTPPKARGIHVVEVVSDSEDELQVLSVTRRNPAGIALKDLFTEDDDECSSPLLSNAAPAISTSQATVKCQATGTTETQPSQDRMRISSILSIPAETVEVVSKNTSQTSTERLEMIDLEHEAAEAEAERELLPEHRTVADVDEVRDETAATTSEKEVQWSDEEDTTPDTQVADVVLPSVKSMLDDTQTTVDTILDAAWTAEDPEQVRKLLEALVDYTTTDASEQSGPVNKTISFGALDAFNDVTSAKFDHVRPISTVLEDSTVTVLPRPTRKRQRDDATLIAPTISQLPTQPGDVSAVSEHRSSAIGESSKDGHAAAEPVHKRARHDAPVASKHDKKVVVPATWQATIKPFMLGALVGGMGVFGGLLSMADMQ